MKRNMGSFDRIFRILVAVVIAALYFTQVVTGTVAIVLLIIDTIFLLTGFIGTCPLYSLLRINTGAAKQ